MKHLRTVTCMIECRGRILMLRRAPTVSVNPRLWSPVAGRIDGRLSPKRQAYKEIWEETGIARRHLRLVRSGKRHTLQVNPSVRASVQPFLFQSNTRRVRLNWENTDYRWVKVSDLSRFKLIPKFDLTLKALKLL
jgi:8-oxo-dGTP pyrophosphatase MutT (NUDIX family)